MIGGLLHPAAMGSAVGNVLVDAGALRGFHEAAAGVDRA